MTRFIEGLDRTQTTPDFKTISIKCSRRGASKESAVAISSQQFVALCRDIDLLDAEIVAIDGSKFKAVNAKARNYTREKLRRRLGEIDEAIARYLAELDRADEVLSKTGMAMPEARMARAAKKLAHYKKEADTLRAVEKRMDTTGETQVSLTDPDCRSMATTSKQPRVVGYNVQSVVETKHHLIVAHEVTNLGYDREALSMMARAAKDVMASESIEAVADKGYYKGEEIVAAEQAGVAVTVSKPNTSGAAAAGRFDRADFVFHADNDAYLCPAGKWLTYHYTNEEAGRTVRYYWTNACETCAIKAKCTPGKERRLKRWEHEAILERVQARLDADPSKIPLRSRTVEHPFGTIKAWMGATHFKMRTMPRVATEMALHVLAYNMMRAMAVVGVPRLISAMRAVARAPTATRWFAMPLQDRHRAIPGAKWTKDKVRRGKQVTSSVQPRRPVSCHTGSRGSRHRVGSAIALVESAALP